jgi:uncharacterized damage-inducible protein DinB
MKETEKIEDQLRRAYGGNAWHGPSLKEILSGVTVEMAVAKPSGGAHSIWEIVLHIAQWETVVRRRLNGGVIDLPPEEDWPVAKVATAEAWKNTLKELEYGNKELRKTVILLTDSDLEKTVPGQRYSNYFMLHGVIQHDLYHAGQIALLKKALG